MNALTFVNTSKHGHGGDSPFSLSVLLAGDDEDAIAGQSLPDPVGLIRIDARGMVTVTSTHRDLGRSIQAVLTALVAEELGTRWNWIRVERAPVEQRNRAETFFSGTVASGRTQSRSQSSWLMYRQAGAAARRMFMDAAAKSWGVPVATVDIRDGTVSVPGTRHRVALGELAEAAGLQPIPRAVALRDLKAFSLIGQSVLQVDGTGKVTGTAAFPIDLRLPDMRVALVARPMRLGVGIADFDATEALRMPGVHHVVQVPTGIAVVADDFWSARRGRDALKIDCDTRDASMFSTAQLRAELLEAVRGDGAVASRKGDADEALLAARGRMALEFFVPHYAHVTMEPTSCIVRVTADHCEVWGGPQMQLLDPLSLARELGFRADQIELHMINDGGSFGRRAQPNTLAHIEAVRIARTIGDGRPLKVIWTPEEDIASAQSSYRPAYAHRIEAGWDATGHLTVWKHHVAGQPVMGRNAAAGSTPGIDIFAVEGGIDQPYAVDCELMQYTLRDAPINTSWLRSSGAFHNGFAVESMLDHVARTTQHDPVGYRRALLRDNPLALAVLDLAVDKAGWSKGLSPGRPGERRGRGVAIVPTHRSFAASVVEVTITPDDEIVVDRVVTALDCGHVADADAVIAQAHSATAWALAAGLHGKITFRDGAVVERDFDTFRIARIFQMPRVDVHLVPSDATAKGTGDVPGSTFVPALANAIFDATGQRLTRLPLTLRVPAAEGDVP